MKKRKSVCLLLLLVLSSLIAAASADTIQQFNDSSNSKTFAVTTNFDTNFTSWVSMRKESAVDFATLSIKGYPYLANWWNRDWGLRKKIDMTSSFKLFDHQVFVSIDLTDLISQGKIKRDLSDIRFTDSQGNPLSYWIEGYSGNLYAGYDDGAICYVNDVKVLDAITEAHGISYWNRVVDVSQYLKPGKNLVACWVANGGDNYGGWMGAFDSKLVVDGNTVIPQSDDDSNSQTKDGNCAANPVWKYFACQHPCEPTSWYSTILDDSSWKSGNGPFGYTYLTCTAGPLQLAPDDTFFRKEFNLPAKIWVKVSSIPYSTSIYMYYDNSAATQESNAENVFLFYDDFTTFDSKKFAYGIGYSGYNPTYYAVGNGMLALWSDNSYRILRMNRNFTSGENVIVTTRFKASAATGWHQNYFVQYDDVNRNRFGLYEDGALYLRVQYPVNGVYDSPPVVTTLTADTWYKDEIIKKSPIDFEARVYSNEGTLVGNFQRSQQAWSNLTWTWVTWQQTGSPVYYDWIRIRKYAPQEPTISVGAEEGWSEPYNPKLWVAFDDNLHWSWPGFYTGSNFTDSFHEKFNDFLMVCTQDSNSECQVPIKVESERNGIMELANLYIKYRTCPPNCDDGDDCTIDFCSKQTDFECQHKYVCRDGFELCVDKKCVKLCGVLDNYCPPECSVFEDKDCCLEVKRAWCGDTCCPYGQVCLNGFCQNAPPQPPEPQPENNTEPEQNKTEPVPAETPNIKIVYVNTTNESLFNVTISQNQANASETKNESEGNQTTFYVYVPGNASEKNKTDFTVQAASTIVKISDVEAKLIKSEQAYMNAKEKMKVVDEASQFLNKSRELLEKAKAKMMENNFDEASLLTKRIDENLGDANKIIDEAKTDWLAFSINFLIVEGLKRLFWVVMTIAGVFVITSWRSWKQYFKSQDVVIKEVKSTEMGFGGRRTLIEEKVIRAPPKMHLFYPLWQQYYEIKKKQD